MLVPHFLPYKLLALLVKLPTDLLLFKLLVKLLSRIRHGLNVLALLHVALVELLGVTSLLDLCVAEVLSVQVVAIGRVLGEQW